MPYIDTVIRLWVWDEKEGDVEREFTVKGTVELPDPGYYGGTADHWRADDPGNADYVITDENGIADPPYLTSEHHWQVHEAVMEEIKG